MTQTRLPIIDISRKDGVAAAIGRACRDLGFFYVIGHGVPAQLVRRLDAASRRFFAQPLAEKMRVSMEHGGRAWRGYFPVGSEQTSGRPDQKEGLYFGQELAVGDPRVVAGTPLHGPNLFPDDELRDVVLEYVERLTELGYRLMRLIGASLDVDPEAFHRRYAADPLVLFRVFHYPPTGGDGWGVGEHTDYGVLTILAQDDRGGLQVRTDAGWIDALPVDGAFVCNLGDMLERITSGAYRSTPHRVRNVSGRGRLSFPFFFDPGYDAEVRPLEDGAAPMDAVERWDGASVHAFEGRYGDYVVAKVSKVFPELARRFFER